MAKAFDGSQLQGSWRLPWVLIVALALFLGSLGLAWGLPGVDSWSNDDPSPRVPLRIAAIWLTDTHKYPYFQLGVDRLLYAPYLTWLAHDGGIRPDCRPLEDCFVDEARAATGLMTISRLRSLALFLGLVLAVGALTARLFADRRAALWAALFTALTAELTFFAKLGNLDLPYTFWFALSLIPFLGIVDRGRRRDYLGFGLLASLAITTKDQVIGAYVLPGLAILVLHARRAAEADGWPARLRRFLDARLLGLIAVLLGSFALINDLLFNWRGFVAHLDYYVHGDGAMVNPGFHPAAELAQLGAFVVRVGQAMGRPLALLAVAGLVGTAWRRWDRGRWLLLPLASYYLFMMLPVVYTDTRFTLPALALLCPAAGWLAARLWDGRADGKPSAAGPDPAEPGPAPAAGARAWRLGSRALVGGVVLYSLLYSLNMGLAMRGDTRYAAEDYLRRQVAMDDAVVAMDESRYLPRLETMGLTDLRFVDWRDLDDPEEGTAAMAALDRARWIVLSDKAAARQTGAAGALRDRLLDGSEGFEVAWEGRATAPFDAWLPWAWVESRVSPRVWVLRRTGEGTWYRTTESSERS